MALHPSVQRKTHCLSRKGGGKNLIHPEGQEIPLGPGAFTDMEQESATPPLETHHRAELGVSSTGGRGKNPEKYDLQSPGAQGLADAERRPGR